MISKYVAREQITISTSAKNLDADGANTLFTTANRGRITYADIDVQDDDVYVTFDGSTTPSATAGYINVEKFGYAFFGGIVLHFLNYYYRKGIKKE